MRRPISAVVLFLSLAPVTHRAASAQSWPWSDPSLAPERRAELLVAAMTLDEKIALVHGADGPYCGDVPANTRLGIPSIGLSDGPAGVTCWSDPITGVTAFPAPVSVAAAWDPAQAREIGAAIGTEARGKGIDVVLAPMLNTVRDGRFGRAFEVYGEDPWLAAALAGPIVRGIEGAGAIATPKAFVNNDQETLRGASSSEVSERAQREIYHPPFRAAARAGAGAFMSAYNRVNGRWTSEAEDLGVVLKEGWGFRGFVMTDWWAQFSSVAAANNGLDLEMPSDYHFGAPLRDAVQSGVVPLRQLDAMARRIAGAMFRAGMFDRVDAGRLDAVVRTPEHAALSRRAAEDGTVLLKNDGTLPLPSTVASIAVIGSAADEAPLSNGGGSSAVILPYEITPLDGIAARAGAGVAVTYSPGDGGRIAAAVAAAEAADVAVVVVGQRVSEGEDRVSLALPGDQDELIAAVAAANPRTLVVMNVPAQTLTPWADDVAAIVVPWYPGQENGHALAAVLFGDAEPGGRLPVTFPRAAAETPTADSVRFPGQDGRVRYDEGLLVGYRWYDATGVPPRFPFGHGLSYTSFEYANLDVAGPGASGQVEVGFEVRNTGARAGVEVAQLYLGFPAAAGAPPRQLRAFERLALASGEVRRVRLDLTLDDFVAWDDDTRGWRVVPGTYAVDVGASSRDIRLAGGVVLAPEPAPADENNRALFVPASSAAGAAARAVDGDPATGWVAESGDALTVDLGTPHSVARVTLRWGGAFASAYVIESSESGVDWTVLAEESSADGAIDDHFLAPEVSARYVRVTLSAGPADLREIEVYAGAQRPFGACVALPGRVEAESFDEGGEGVAHHGADIVADPGAGGGLAVGSIADGEWLEYTVDFVDPSAIYDVRLRVSGGSAGAKVRVRVDGTPLAVVPIPASGAAWREISAGLLPVPRGGRRTLRLEFEAGGFRVDWLEFERRRSCRAVDAALGRPVVFSNSQDAQYDGAHAVDGNPGTRWASQPFWDPQWIWIDLGAREELCWVRLDWEYAYGKDYGIHVSDDAQNWRPVTTVTGGDGGEDRLATPDAGRYVLMYGTGRGTPWGYSLYDFEVYAACSTTWFRDADGDGFGDPAAAFASCGQPHGYVVDRTDCDDTDPLVHPGETESCNSRDDDCNGTADDGIAALVGTPDLDVRRDRTVTWTALAGATAYDLSRGGLAALAGAGGDFAAAGAICLADDTFSQSLVDTLEPPPGDGLWYLARAVSSCTGPGTYDDAGIPAERSRDPGLTPCP